MIELSAEEMQICQKALSDKLQKARVELNEAKEEKHRLPNKMFIDMRINNIKGRLDAYQSVLKKFEEEIKKEMRK